MVLPLVAYNIFEHFLIDRAATDVDCDVFALMLGLQELGYSINIVAIQLLDA